MTSLRRIAQQIRHQPGLERAEWLWSALRRPYHKLLDLRGAGVDIAVGGIANVRMPTEFVGGAWEQFEPASVAAYWHWLREHPRGIVLDIDGTEAWQIQISALLTPHDQNAFDNVVISRPLEWKQHGYGAFELVARYHEQHIDSSVFPTFADPNQSARQARAFGVGVNWYANRFFRAAINYDRTDFVGGGSGGTDRAPENALIGRLQAVF